MFGNQDRIELLQSELRDVRLRTMSWRIVFFAIIAGLAGRYLYNNYAEFRRYSEHEYACQRNLKVIARALDSFGTGHGGKYPTKADGRPSLEILVPDYAKEIPVCPENGAAYGVLYGANGQFNLKNSEDYYQVWCRGEHPHNASGFPWIDSLRGLVRIPTDIKVLKGR